MESQVMHRSGRSLCIIVLTAGTLVGCASLQDNVGKAVGATVGASLGLVGCKELGGSDAECAAAAIAGGVVGYSLGNLYDKRRARLAKAAASTGADIEFESIEVSTVAAASPSSDTTDSDEAPAETEGLLAAIRQDEMFVVGSATPSNVARETFLSLAEVYAEQFELEDGTEVDTRLLIVGHADATGGALRNQQLSERRALAIARIFSDYGLPDDQLYVSGAGSSQPIADNATEAGRRQNRRVEILEITNEAGLVTYAETRKRDPELLAHSTRAPEQPEPQAPPPPPAGIDFAGRPADRTDTSVLDAIKVAGGKGERRANWVEAFSTDGSNRAREVPQIPCVADAPRLSGQVLNFSTGQDVSDRHTGDAMLPGMNQVPWQAVVNGHLVGVKPVSVLESTAQALDAPLFEVYVDANGTGRAAAAVETLVETYRSDSGILYRLFALEGGSEFYCIDLALPVSAPFEAMAGLLYYGDNQSLYQTAFKPSAAIEP